MAPRLRQWLLAGSLASLCGAGGCTAPVLVMGVLYGIRTPQRSRAEPIQSAVATDHLGRATRTRVVAFVGLELALERSARQREAPSDHTPAPLALELAPSDCELEASCVGDRVGERVWERDVRERALWPEDLEGE